MEMTHLSFIYPGWHFSSFFFTQGGMNSIWLKTQSPDSSHFEGLVPGEYIFVCDKTPKPFFVCLRLLFLFLTFMSDKTFLNGLFPQPPMFNRQERALLIDMSSERESPGPWKQIL